MSQTQIPSLKLYTLHPESAILTPKSKSISTCRDPQRGGLAQRGARVFAAAAMHLDIHMDVHMDVYMDVHMDVRLNAHMNVHMNVQMHGRPGENPSPPLGSTPLFGDPNICLSQ